MSCSWAITPGLRLVNIRVLFYLLASGGGFLCLPCWAGAAASPPVVPQPLEGAFGSYFFWIGLLVFLGAMTAVGVLMMKRLRRHRALAVGTSSSEPSPAAATHGVAPNGSKPGGGRKGTGFSLAGLKPKSASSSKLVNNNDNNHDAPRRKRVFNYAKFYTEMVLQGPSPSTAGDAYNGYEWDVSRYFSQPIPVEAAKPDSGAILNANSEMIANQKTLIEEQKRLISEQGRLIEEKTKLIAEKNQLLKRQSELVDNNLV